MAEVFERRRDMAYSEALADRVRQTLHGRAFTEKKMFGGLAFLVNGNMCCGPVGDKLMVRLGPEGAAAALDQPHMAPMDFTGKPMRSMAYLTEEGCASDEELERWINEAYRFAASLPRK